jgi:ribonuclease III
MRIFGKPKTKSAPAEPGLPLEPPPPADLPKGDFDSAAPRGSASPHPEPGGRSRAPQGQSPQGQGQGRGRNPQRNQPGGQPRSRRQGHKPSQGTRPPQGPSAQAAPAKPVPPPPAARPPRQAPVPRTTPFEEQIRYFFRSKELREQALTHSSYAYENQGRGRDNELLEFLGDSVIGLIAADYFFSNYRDTTEGDLSKLKSSASSTVALAEFAKQINLDKHIRLGRGEERSGGRHKSNILADVFEAVVGAIYLDGGYEAARYFFLPLIESTFQKVQTSGYTVDNYKSALQEYLQKEDLPSPNYKVVSCTGPDHDRVFTVEVFANRTSLAKAKGASRKAAEQKAAEMALKSFLGRKIKSLTPETFIVEK